MGSGFDARYEPRAAFTEIYQELYKKYQSLGKFTEKQ
jgi:hypothetical protein